MLPPHRSTETSPKRCRLAAVRCHADNLRTLSREPVRGCNSTPDEALSLASMFSCASLSFFLLVISSPCCLSCCWSPFTLRGWHNRCSHRRKLFRALCQFSLEHPDSESSAGSDSRSAVCDDLLHFSDVSIMCSLSFRCDHNGLNPHLNAAAIASETQSRNPKVNNWRIPVSGPVASLAGSCFHLWLPHDCFSVVHCAPVTIT